MCLNLPDFLAKESVFLCKMEGWGSRFWAQLGLYVLLGIVVCFRRLGLSCLLVADVLLFDVFAFLVV